MKGTRYSSGLLPLYVSPILTLILFYFICASVNKTFYYLIIIIITMSVCYCKPVML